MTQEMMAFTFPGQGSQKIGMAQAWAARSAVARETFEEADDILGEALSRLCWEGPEEDLQLTVNTQPALLTASVAIYRAVREAGLDAVAVAGHSLGEYSALVAAETLTFADGLRLVRQRGRAMQDAVPVGVGAMAALIGLDDQTVTEIAQEAAPETAGDEVCAVANYNSEGQTVLAGHKAAVERAVEIAKGRGARKAVLLAVSAPFHSPLMAPARAAMTPHLQAVHFSDPRIPVVTNVDARPVTTGAEAREALVRQIDSTVRWTESVLHLAKTVGITSFAEVGPGKVLTGLNRRIARGVQCWSLSEPESLDRRLQEG